MYLHIEVWVDVLLFHQLFDLLTPLDQLPDFFGQDSHLQVRIRNLGNLLRLILLLPRKQGSEVSWDFSPGKKESQSRDQDVRALNASAPGHWDQSVSHVWSSLFMY